MAKDVAFETEGGPAVMLWVNDLVAIQFHSPAELEQFANDIHSMIPEIIESQATY